MKKIALTSLLFLLFLFPLIGHAAQTGQIIVDQYGDITGYYILNVTNAPTTISIRIPGNITGYGALDLESNQTLPVSLSGNVLNILVGNNTLVNVTFISSNAADLVGDAFTLNLDLPSETNIILPSNAIIMYTNATILDLKGNIISVEPGNVSIDYSLSEQTSTTTTSTTTTSSIYTSTTSTPLTSTVTTSISSKISYTTIGIAIVIVIIVIIIAFIFMRRNK